MIEVVRFIAPYQFLVISTPFDMTMLHTFVTQYSIQLKNQRSPREIGEAVISWGKSAAKKMITD